MRKLIYTNMVSLDGFMEGPDGGLDWATIDEELHTFVNDMERQTGALLYGRKIYELMQAFWPTADANPEHPPYIIEYAHIWKSIPKIVFSRTLERVADDARLLKEVRAETIMALKTEAGKNLEVGGANLASAMIRLGLVDEYRLFIHPVILGAGKPTYPQLDGRIVLDLLEERRFASGVVYLHYQTAAR